MHCFLAGCPAGAAARSKRRGAPSVEPLGGPKGQFCGKLTKSGFVYVISNIGSFGERVFKIGMTRRMEPMDRIDELSDASVPFPLTYMRCCIPITHLSLR